MPVCYSVEEFASALGYRPGDWGLDPQQTISVTDQDQIVVCDRLVGHVTDTEREMLDTAVGRVANPLEPGWLAAAAFVGRFFGGWAGWGLGRLAFGGIREDAEGLGPLWASRVVGQLVGAAGAAAIAAPTQMRTRAALGAAAGAWVPFLGAPLAAVGAYVATRPRAQNPLSPGQRRWMWIGGGVLAALFVGGGVAYARVRKRMEPSPPLSPEAAVDRAIELIGQDQSAQEVADAAYPMAYPDCPAMLDPDDPTHASCVEYWWHLHDLAAERLPPPGTGPEDEGPATEGPAVDMRAWLDSLTPHQRSELRRIIGPTYYDPIKDAAYAGDDGKTVGSVLRLKNAIQTMMSKEPLEAARRYGELKDLLGPKLDELMDAAEKYEGG